MKKLKICVSALMISTIALGVFSSCKKGTDDPVVSLMTRKDRLTNTWTLTKYEKNSASQDLNGSTYTYTIFNNGTLSQVVEGSIFGFPTRTTKQGTWTLLNDDEDVKIMFPNDTVIYNLQRLASKELWLKKTVSTDTYVYYFSGL